MKAVGFDFDGTLIVSDQIKQKIYFDIFFERYRVRVKYNGKALNREEKIKYFFKRFVKRKFTGVEVKAVSEEFGKRYAKSLRTCPLFQCTNLVRELRRQVEFTFLLSLENRVEVVSLLKHCG